MWLDIALIIFFVGGFVINHLDFAAALVHCDSQFEIRFVELDCSCPQEALVLSLQPSGGIYDLDGHTIEDADLTRFLGCDNL
jgi:hypothetical protein